VDKVTPLVPDDCVPFVGEALRRLRAEVGNEAAVLGFVGAPFTLATYIVEGGWRRARVRVARASLLAACLRVSRGGKGKAQRACWRIGVSTPPGEARSGLSSIHPCI
jgi:hypothetical protein